ncbi:MAG: hypothetical protein KME50_10930 [Nostoc desertorum CM1-VF14]|jgi:hypothetical protein|nr:hypothetical protein [Nostoc desertorum CM1-VF14]
MVDGFIRYYLYIELVLGYLQIQLGVICSVGIWTLSEAKLQAAQAHQTWKPSSGLTEQATNVNPESAEQDSKLRTHRDVRALAWSDSTALASLRVSGKPSFGDLEFSMSLPYRLKQGEVPTVVIP